MIEINKIVLIFIFILIHFKETCAQTKFDSVIVTVSPTNKVNAINVVHKIQINWTTTPTIPANSVIIIKIDPIRYFSFDSNPPNLTPMKYQIGSQSAVSVNAIGTLQTQTYEIRLSSANYNFATEKVMEFRFTMNNGRCNCKVGFQVSIENSSGTQLYQGTGNSFKRQSGISKFINIFINQIQYVYTTEESTSCKVTLSDNITGEKNPKFTIQKLSTVRIQFNKWFNDMYEGVFYDMDENTSCDYQPQSGQAALFNPKFRCFLSASGEYIEFNQINQLDFPNTQTYQLILKQFRNPFSTMKEQIVIRVYESIESSLELKDATIPIKFNLQVIPKTPLTDQAIEQKFTFNGISQTPFSASNTFLRVTYDQPLVITHLPSMITGTVQGSRMQLDVYNFVPSNLSTGGVYEVSFNIKSPRFARQNKIKFEVMYKKDSNIYIQEQIENEYEFKTAAGVLVSTISSIVDPTIGVVTEYTFKITATSKYDSSTKLYINFPTSGFSLSSSSCSFVSGPINTSVSCSELSSHEIETSNIFTSSSLNIGSNFEIKIKGIRNPLTTQLSDIIVIQTKSSDNNIIEESATIQVKAEPKTLKAALVLSDMTVGSTSSIGFEITPDITIPVNGGIEITFPSDFFYSSNPKFENPINIANTVISGTYPVYKISASSSIAASQKISFSLNGVRNPLSTKLTGSFIIKTLDSTGNIIEQKKADLTAQMTKKAQTTKVEITPGNPYIAQNNVDYVFTITLKVPHSGTNTFNVVFPTEIALNNSIQCSSLIGLTSIGCTKNQNSIAAVVTFGTFPSDNIVSFVVKTANNYYVSGQYNFSFSSQTSSGDGIEESPTIGLTLKPSPFTQVKGTNVKTKMTQNNNNYQIQLTPSASVPPNSVNTSIEIVLPTQITLDGNSRCQITSPPNISCVADIPNKKFKCSPAGSFDQLIIINLTNIGFSYTSTGKSDSLTVSTFYNNNALNQVSSGLELIHDCDPNCFECSPTNSPQCTSCFTSTNPTTDNLLQGKTCKATCDQGYIAETGSTTCESCGNNCSTCKTTKDTCTSCAGNFYLEGTDCVSTCKPGYYGNKAKNICAICSSPCETCENSNNYCTTCLNTGSNTLSYKGTCISSCLADVSIKIGNKCVPCTDNCVKCQNDPNQCLICKDPFNLSGTQCVTSCPAATFPNGGKCLKCFDPCVTCQGSPSFCTSCQSPFYSYNGQCVNAPCPIGTYQIELNRSCNSCPKECQACTSQTECTSCDVSGGFPILFNKQCLSECPSDRPLRTSTGCEECDSNCLLCKTVKNMCTACKAPLYLYGAQCKSDCPSGFVKNSDTNTCDNPVNRETRIYFPYLIGACIFLGISAASKAMAKESQFFTNGTAFTSIFEFLSWLTTGILQFNYNNAYEERDIKAAIGVFWFGFIIYVITNIVTFVFIKKKFLTDVNFQEWKSYSTGHQYSTKVIQVFTLIFSFKFFRFIYGRFLIRSYLSSRFVSNNVVFKPTNFISILSFLLSSTFIIAGAALSCYETQLIKDNLYYFSIETIIITLIMLFFIIGDIFKEQDYFAYDQTYNRKYLENISPQKNPLMNEGRNNIDNSVLQKSAYDRLNNSNLNNTGLINKSRQKNGQSSLNELEAVDLNNNNSVDNSVLNSQDRIAQNQKDKYESYMIKEEDNKDSKIKKNSLTANQNGESKLKSPKNDTNNDPFSKNKKDKKSDIIQPNKVLIGSSKQNQNDPLKDPNNLDKEKEKEKEKDKLKNKTEKDKNKQTLDGKNKDSMLNEKDSILNDKDSNDQDSNLNDKNSQHMIHSYDKGGNSKQNLNSASNPSLNPDQNNKSKRPSIQNMIDSSANNKDKFGNKQNSPKLIGLDDQEVESNYNPSDQEKQQKKLINDKNNSQNSLNNNKRNSKLGENNPNNKEGTNKGDNSNKLNDPNKNNDLSKGNDLNKSNNPNDPNNKNNQINSMGVIDPYYEQNNKQNGNSAHGDKKDKKRKIFDDNSGNQDYDSESGNSGFQDSPSRYNMMNMRYEDKDLINIQQARPYLSNILAATGMQTLPNSSPLNYGQPIQESAYSSLASSQNQGSILKGPAQNTFFTPSDSLARKSQTLNVTKPKDKNNQNKTKKLSNITPSKSFSRNHSPSSIGKGNTYGMTPNSNILITNGQNVVKTHSDYDDGVKISKFLDQDSKKNLKAGGQPFFTNQNMSSSAKNRDKLDYLDNYDFSIPQTTMNYNNNYQNDFNSEASKSRAESNPRIRSKISSRATRTLENDPKIKQLEDIYNQKLVPPIKNSQRQQNNGIKSNKKSTNGLTIHDPANFSDYEGDDNTGYY